MKKIVVPLIALLLLGGACAKKTTRTNTNQSPSGQTATNQTSTADQAVTDGLNLTSQLCTGTDKPKLTHLPMDPADFAFILPYGLMVGGHVTPVDHQYFSPIIFDSPIGKYNVYAMADSHIVGITTRVHKGQGQNKNIDVTDYRIVFAVSCKLLYYYDLVNTLAPDIKAKFDQGEMDIPVTSGQLIGKIGGQTLDFAVWDTDINLTGFVNPDHYRGESWKIHTADPLLYETDEVKAASLAKYARSVEPRSGKIDFDVDGKAIGTWFQVGTNGYAGPGQPGQSGYWSGHLSLAPYFLDPSAFLVSIGNWPGQASQFATKESTPNPADVTVATGLVKYTLVPWRDYLSSGGMWDNMSPPTSAIVLHKQTQVEGCFLLQMLGDRSLKAEAFKGKSCVGIDGFDANAVIYER